MKNFASGGKLYFRLENNCSIILRATFENILSSRKGVTKLKIAFVQLSTIYDMADKLFPMLDSVSN